ncbi:hypothetical protein VA7868_01504 [Vibrio aerogenes CECT 7868]|uniref:Bacterial toxin 44 domain-containing protein n=1 Tax=Vibrio aerogenes CECT 7868 TaxID=1216006 RepID=A0A1M5Y530_9VIBR|nr:polymorphic toxin type 44 domain-containing protein [Vibrio aerogenes]SHI07180.1 hypothetical protein VA7868_01504 [Vibrio aerogenes CECT 7868]
MSDPFANMQENFPFFQKMNTSLGTCSHPDRALDVAKYIIGEMQRNVKSTQAYSIKLSNIEATFLPAAKIAAYAIWAERVGPGQPWDHKNKISGNHDLDTHGESTQFHHKYREFEYFYDIWSNIHYGYVGKACRFSDAELLDGAGLAQLLDDAVKKNKSIQYSPSIPGFGFRKFDDITDSISVRLGIALFHDYPDPNQITPDILMSYIEKAPYPIRKYSKLPHQCKGQ